MYLVCMCANDTHTHTHTQTHKHTHTTHTTHITHTTHTTHTHTPLQLQMWLIVNGITLAVMALGMFKFAQGIPEMATAAAAGTMGEAPPKPGPLKPLFSLIGCFFFVWYVLFVFPVFCCTIFLTVIMLFFFLIC